MSTIFYGIWKWEFLFILFPSIISNYFLGNLIIKKQSKKLLVLAVILNISALFYYKYFNFFKAVTGLGEIYNIVLPLGISFFTFTQISFLVDCYKNKVSLRENKFTDYALFVTYFPHLIAGPILHHKDMMNQFRNEKIRKFDIHNFSIGITIFTIGLLKKIILADNIMLFVDPVFQNSNQLNFLDAWGGALSYSLQLYFDFSGYSDMAIGISKIFNIDLPINFNSPYKAKNITDFWRRWHISLTNFLKEYVYIPLGGNKVGISREYINIFFVFFISGVWHGANFTFFIWGILHGIFMLIHKAFTSFKNKHIPHFKMPFLIGNLLGHILTLVCVTIGWVIFRASSIGSAMDMLKSMFLLTPSSVTHYFPVEGWWGVAILSIICLFLPNTLEFVGLGQVNEKSTKIKKEFLRWKPNMIYAILLSFLLVLCIFNLNKKSEFLYFQF